MGAGVLQETGVVDPAFVGGAIQTGDDRYVGRLDSALHQRQIAFGAGLALCGFGKVAERLAETVGAGRKHSFGNLVLSSDLLLEQREHNDGGGIAVLQLLDAVQALRNRSRRGDDRMLQSKAHISGVKLHRSGPS